MKTGVLSAKGNYVLFTDADLSAPIDELAKLLSAAEEQQADIVIGSRAVDRSFIQKHQSPGREIGGMVFNLMVPAHPLLRPEDTRQQCGLSSSGVPKHCQMFEKMTVRGFGFDSDSSRHVPGWRSLRSPSVGVVRKDPNPIHAGQYANVLRLASYSVEPDFRDA